MHNVSSEFAGLLGGSQHLCRHSGAFAYKTPELGLENVYHHTTLNTPVLVRSRKLSNVGPGQYLDGGPPGNSRCGRLLVLGVVSGFFLLVPGGLGPSTA